MEQFARHRVSYTSLCLDLAVVYGSAMPRLWNNTIEGHRQAVHEAILDSVDSLVAEHGLGSATMSQIAAKTGIGRATLYKYFADVEAVLSAWHQRHVARHLDHLTEIRTGRGPPSERLESVLKTYALISYRRGRHSSELVALLHSGDDIVRAQLQLVSLIEDMLKEAAERGHVRDDISPHELATYCVHALAAAGNLSSEPAVRRLVRVVLGGLQPTA